MHHIVEGTIRPFHGVIEHPDGQTIAITALSTPNNPAAEAPLGAAARALNDHLRQPRTN